MRAWTPSYRACFRSIAAFALVLGFGAGSARAEFVLNMTVGGTTTPVLVDFFPKGAPGGSTVDLTNPLAPVLTAPAGSAVNNTSFSFLGAIQGFLPDPTTINLLGPAKVSTDVLGFSHYGGQIAGPGTSVISFDVKTPTPIDPTSFDVVAVSPPRADFPGALLFNFAIQGTSNLGDPAITFSYADGNNVGAFALQHAPEPASLGLAAFGALALLGYGRRRAAVATRER